jgi:hypothetical protein
MKISTLLAHINLQDLGAQIGQNLSKNVGYNTNAIYFENEFKKTN